MGDDEVVSWAGGVILREGERVDVVSAQAGGGCGVSGMGAAGEQAQHGGAGVDGVSVEVRVSGEQRGGEAAVAVAEKECGVGGGIKVSEVREEVVAAAGECVAEGEGFHPAIGARDGIEVG